MHRALIIPEIAFGIVAQIPDDKKQILLSLALAGGEFQKPALDALWRDPGPDVPHHILKCFPPGVFALSFSSTGSRRLKVNLLRPPLPDELKRPSDYCKRVKRFCLGPNVDKYKDPLSVLSMLLPAEHLFPHRLHFSHTPPPSLTWLKFSGRNLNVVLLSTLAAALLKPGAPRLRRVSFAGQLSSPLSEGECAAVSLFLRSLQHITHLHLPSAKDQDLFHLSQLSRLKSLQLDAFPATYIPDAVLDHLASECPFPFLSKLKLSQASLHAVCQLVPLVADTLRSLGVQPDPLSTSADICALFDTIAEHVPTSLLEFTIRCKPAPTGEDDRWKISSKDLAALYYSAGLTTVSISTRSGFDGLCDNTLRTMAESWCRLTSLCLVQDQMSSATTQLALQSLVFLADNCLLLESLAVAVSTTVIPATPADRVVQPTLRTLDVGFSRITDVFGVTRFLSATFPGIREVKNKWGFAVDNAVRWKQVSDWVPRLAIVRREEQRCGCLSGMD
ncbi:hypothetical protein MKEN_00838500 [Mycena kentingensis (nom. inval.)]|nr:hypothetical protein MKEN_00838500 [Mycena kentingensis (nom. inval.)]